MDTGNQDTEDIVDTVAVEVVVPLVADHMRYFSFHSIE